MSDMTEINIRDANGKMEYTILCDLEAGLVHGWIVNLTEALPIQTVLNVPMLVKQAGINAPCSQQQQSVVQQKQVPNEQLMRTAKKIRIGKDGTPIIVE